MAGEGKDIGDVLADAFVTPEASHFIQKVLKKALYGEPDLSDQDSSHASALLANLLMNDHLNGWDTSEDLVEKAEKALQNAPKTGEHIAFIHHAQGLIHRANGHHKEAQDIFQEAVKNDQGFARAHAQLGNQKLRFGDVKTAHEHIDEAIRLSPHHPACGYFYWVKGRAFFQEEKWDEAVEWLKKSVDALPTVWYNRAYLASAQHHAAKAVRGTIEQQKGGSNKLRELTSDIEAKDGERERVTRARRNLGEGLK